MIFWRQVRELTIASLKSRYRKTVAGFLWVILNPLMQYSVQAMVFGSFLRINIERYPIFLLSGLLPWIFMTSTLEMSCSLLVTSRDFLKAYRVSGLVLFFSQVLDNLINFMAAFLTVLIPLTILGHVPWAGLLFVPLAMIPLALFAAGTAVLLGTTHVFFRDTRFILQFVLSISYFVTPIFYGIQLVPEQLRWVIYLNPLYALILPFRDALYLEDYNAFFGHWLVAMGIGTTAAVAGWTFWKARRTAVYLHV